MNDPLPLDVMERLHNDFGDRANAVASLIIGSADRLGDRVVRCIVYAARGDESKVQHFVETARQDFRDVIISGEYDGSMEQVRDLRASFLINSPEKFWIGEVACMMDSRGYRLTALETRLATEGPFAYTSDRGEGRATFLGPKGEVGIEKRDRQWLVHGNRRDLETHGLDHAFSDERAFHDAVSGYLLSKISPRAVDEPSATHTARGARPWPWRWRSSS